MQKKLATILLLAVATLVSTCGAEEPKWRELFDGKTLEKWKTSDFGGQAKPRVEGNQIVIPIGAPLSGVTYTGGDIPKIDYEVELEAQRVDGGDFFCGLTVPFKDSNVSLILGGWGGSICGLSSLDGEDAANNETSKSVTFVNKKWYKVRLRVRADKIRAWIDDEEIVDANVKDRKVGIRWEVEASCPFGVSTYQTTGAIRNIRIRPVGADE